jgi:hypothetical protein
MVQSINTYVGIWIDFEKAIIASIKKGKQLDSLKEILGPDESIKMIVDGRVRLSGGSRMKKTPYGPQDISDEKRSEHRRENHLRRYYREILDDIHDARKVFICGPGEAKIEFKKELEKKSLASKISGFESADKMTANQFMAKVRKFFRTYT